MTLILSFFVPFPKFHWRAGATPPDAAQQQQQQQQAYVDHALRLRKPLHRLLDMARKTETTGYFKWAQRIGQDIVEATVHVPRNDVVLDRWGFDTTITMVLPPTGTVPIHVAFPVGLLPTTIAVPKEEARNDGGCLELRDDNTTILQHLAADTPVVVFVHGGGLTVGTARMEECVDLLHQMDTEQLKNVIYVTIDYSLAPEFSFPTAVLEIHSVLTMLLERFTAISLVGISAGGLLALSVGWQMLRENKRLRSIMALCPMVDPAADSPSYYQHGKNLAVPTHWLRWSWRRYLGVSEPEAAHEKEPQASDTRALLAVGSNRHVWEASHWYKSTTVRRLVHPNMNLPLALQGEEAPRIVISTNSADPLHDEGVALVEQLRSHGAAVTHLDHRGSHFVGTMLDAQGGLKELLEEFRQNVFGTSNIA